MELIVAPKKFLDLIGSVVVQGRLLGPSVTLLDFYYVGVSGLYRAWIDHGT